MSVMPSVQVLPVALPAPIAGPEVCIGDRFRFTGTRAQLDGPTMVEVTDISVTGMVGLQVSTPESKFPQFTAIPLERTALLLSAGIWVRTESAVTEG